jgi:hypothetical protein
MIIITILFITLSSRHYCNRDLDRSHKNHRYVLIFSVVLFGGLVLLSDYKCTTNVELVGLNNLSRSFFWLIIAVENC